MGIISKWGQSMAVAVAVQIVDIQCQASCRDQWKVSWFQKLPLAYSIINELNFWGCWGCLDPSIFLFKIKLWPNSFLLSQLHAVGHEWIQGPLLIFHPDPKITSPMAQWLLVPWFTLFPHFLPAQVADEETLPFKLIYALMHEEGGLRMFISPDSTHAQWNNVRCGIRRAGLQHTILLATIMSNVLHGPFKSGQNRQSFQEGAEHLSQTMSYDDFLTLVDLMAMDRGVDVDDPSLPTQPSEIQEQKCIKQLPIFATSVSIKAKHLLFAFPVSSQTPETLSIKRTYVFFAKQSGSQFPLPEKNNEIKVKNKSWFASIGVMSHLVENWSLMSEVLHHCLDLDNASWKIFRNKN